MFHGLDDAVARHGLEFGVNALAQHAAENRLRIRSVALPPVYRPRPPENNSLYLCNKTFNSFDISLLTQLTLFKLLKLGILAFNSDNQ
ncbi:unnamed protein product [Arctia plantaginis]|uniref:Uncharacterized protein n=1 Tax=Arctia plantaginis TaxID=874455 RepID=A0A8S1AKK5_ARCPL|nr:unnamed protein product [Arctia plantaginis]